MPSSKAFPTKATPYRDLPPKCTWRIPSYGQYIGKNYDKPRISQKSSYRLIRDFREHLKGQPWFLPSNIGYPCKLSHHPLQRIKQTQNVKRERWVPFPPGSCQWAWVRGDTTTQNLDISDSPTLHNSPLLNHRFPILKYLNCFQANLGYQIL
jgi:hypothetical protein